MKKKLKYSLKILKNGVQIFDIIGTYRGSGGTDTSDATATASDIVSGKTAYARGSKITGNVKEVKNSSTSRDYFSMAETDIESWGHIQTVRITGKPYYNEDTLVRSGGEVWLDVPYSEYTSGGPIKWFTSIEDMENCSKTIRSGDLALVYTPIYSNIENNVKFSMVYFKDNVILTANELEALFNTQTIHFNPSGEDDFGGDNYINLVTQKEEDEEFLYYNIDADIEASDNLGWVSYVGSPNTKLQRNSDGDPYIRLFSSDIKCNLSNNTWTTIGPILNKFMNVITYRFVGLYIYNGTNWVVAPGMDINQQALDIVNNINGEIV